MTLREKKQKKIEEALEDKECEKGVIYDEDEDADGEININLDEESEEDEEDWDGSEDSEDKDMYESKMDKVDDILFVQDQLNALQSQNQQHWQNVLSLLTQEEQTGLLNFFQQAQIYKNNKDAVDQAKLVATQG